MTNREVEVVELNRMRGVADIAPAVPHFEGDGACAGAESFALMVLGDSMMPEFEPGDIVIIEPDGHVADGSYVFAFWNDEWLFRQLNRIGEAWFLCPLNVNCERIAILNLEAVRGVIIQKCKPGRRRASKRYVG
jgi:SOS-response transcriptional repressor LexA